MAKIELVKLSKSYGAVEVLRDISLVIEDGEFAVIVGPSGSGKSTMLRLFSGLEAITGGDLMFDGERVNKLAPVERGVAMVFQNYALYPHMSVYENIAFGLRERREPKDQIDAKVRHAAQILQIEPLLQRRPKQLSGGQMQRVAIGRAIVREPRVFLFDEPLSNLDAALRGQMRVELKSLHDKLKNTMVYVTHDQVEAMTMADKIFVMNNGRVEQSGSPREVYSRPTTRFVAEFIGSPKMSMLPCHADADTGMLRLVFGGDQSLRVPATSVDASRVATLGVRPEDWTLSLDGPTGLKVQIASLEDLGNELLLHVSSDTDAFTLRHPYTDAFRHGQQLWLTVASEAIHLFDAEGQRL